MNKNVKLYQQNVANNMAIIDHKIGISNHLKIIPNDVKCPKCKCINKWQLYIRNTLRFIDITVEDDEMAEEDHEFECNSDESDHNTQTQVTQATQVSHDINNDNDSDDDVLDGLIGRENDLKMNQICKNRNENNNNSKNILSMLPGVGYCNQENNHNQKIQIKMIYKRIQI